MPFYAKREKEVYLKGSKGLQGMPFKQKERKKAYLKGKKVHQGMSDQKVG